MCEQSAHIKLCTCKVSRRIECNYWLLHRHTGDKGYFVMGTAIPPFGEDILRYQKLEALIEIELNKQNCFDVNMKFSDEDILTIYLGTAEQHETFTYIYTKQKWEIGNYDPFELENTYNQIKEGLIELNIEQFLKDNNEQSH
jgi:hypothetical protein